MLSSCTRIAARPPSQPDSRSLGVSQIGGHHHARSERRVPTSRMLSVRRRMLRQRGAHESFKGETCPHRESTKSSENKRTGPPPHTALGVDKIHKPEVHKPARWGGGGNASSQETGVTVAEASIGAVKEFPEGKPYRVGKVPNAAKNRRREQETPWLHKTQLSTYPQIPQEFPTGYVYSWLNMTNRVR
jgi:hypothetical protein